MLAGYVFSQVRALLDDPEAGFASDDYLVPFLQSAQDDLVVTVLNHANLGKMKLAVTLSSVPAGTQSLAAYFGTGQPLETLEQIIVLREKIAGYAEYLYSYMRPVIVPPYQPVGSNLNGVYTATSSDILLPGAVGATDIQVYGSFRPQTVQSGATPLVPGTESVLKYGVLEAVCKTRGARTSAIDYKHDKIIQQDSLFNNWMMMQQVINVRCMPFRPQQSGPADFVTSY